MNNVLKFDATKRRKPEPENKNNKPENKAARFIWLSALFGPIAAVLVLALFMSFSAIWGGITNPAAGTDWAAIGWFFSVAFLIGVAAVPFHLLFFAPYAMAVQKGYVLLKNIFIKRALMAGGMFGFCAVAAVNMGLIAGFPALGLGQMLFTQILGIIAGLSISFIWANICWTIAGGWKLAPRINDNR